MSIFRFRVFKEYFSQKFRSFAEYPLNFSISLFWALFSLLVFYFFWSLVFSRGTIVNYDLTKMILYYLFVLCLWYDFVLIKSLGRSIVEGDIMKTLVRKVNLEEHFMYTCLSSFIVWMLVPLFVILIVGLYFLGLSALFGILIFIAGMIIGTLIYSLLTCLSFWLGYVWSIFFIVDELIQLCSGSILPLDLFPHLFQIAVIEYLPFNLMFFVPAKVFLGDMTITWALIGKYLIWIIALYLVLKFVIKLGLKRYEQLGG